MYYFSKKSMNKTNKHHFPNKYGWLNVLDIFLIVFLTDTVFCLCPTICGIVFLIISYSKKYKKKKLRKKYFLPQFKCGGLFVLLVFFVLLVSSEAMLRSTPPNVSSHIGHTTNMLTAASKYILSPLQMETLNTNIRENNWFEEFNPELHTPYLSGQNSGPWLKFIPLWTKLFNNIHVIIRVFLMLIGPICMESWSLRSYYPGLLNWCPYTSTSKNKGHGTPGYNTYVDLLIFMKNYGEKIYSVLPSFSEWKVYSKLEKIARGGRDFYMFTSKKFNPRLAMFFTHCQEYVFTQIIYPMNHKLGLVGW